MGILYLPSILQFFWGVESAELSLIWCFIQIFLGIAIYSKDWHRIQKPIFFLNFMYQLTWGFLTIDLMAKIPERYVEYSPYLLHLVIAFSSGWYYFKHKNKLSSLS